MSRPWFFDPSFWTAAAMSVTAAVGTSALSEWLHASRDGEPRLSNTDRAWFHSMSPHQTGAQFIACTRAAVVGSGFDVKIVPAAESAPDYRWFGPQITIRLRTLTRANTISINGGYQIKDNARGQPEYTFGGYHVYLSANSHPVLLLPRHAFAGMFAGLQSGDRHYGVGLTIDSDGQLTGPGDGKFLEEVKTDPASPHRFVYKEAVAGFERISHCFRPRPSIDESQSLTLG